MQNDKNYVRGRVLLTSEMDFVLAAVRLIVLSPLLVLDEVVFPAFAFCSTANVSALDY